MTPALWRAMNESERYAWEQTHSASIVAGATVQVRPCALGGRVLRDAGNILTVLENNGGSTLHCREGNTGIDWTVETRNVVLVRDNLDLWIRLIAETISENDEGHRITGGEPVDKIAAEWSWIPHRPALEAWLNAGCFDGRRTKELHEAGLVPADLMDLNAPNTDETIGYAHSNGDITTSRVCKYVAWIRDGQDGSEGE